jgi:3-hydroxyacyl-CoA dehydrogenase
VAVRFAHDNGIGVITLDNPPINAIGQAARAGLRDALNAALNAGLRRLIITGSGRFFTGGADATEFGRPPEPPHLNEVLLQLAAFPVPTIAAINGTALGGGLEISLACRIRIASPKALLGLPEVTLGIVPGSGGTQRLPRLVGLAKAFDLIANGKTFSANEALALGVVDIVAEDPLETAKALDEATLAMSATVDSMPSPAADPEAEHAARALAGKNRFLSAPRQAIDLIAASASLPISEGLAQERKAFLALRGSEQAEALRHIFFAERAAVARAKEFSGNGRTISTAVVVGGGNMGAAIAYALVNAQIKVVIVETDEAAAGRARENVKRLVDQGMARGSVSAQRAGEIHRDLSFAIGYDALPKADLAIEAAFEDFDVKRNIFAELQARMPKDAILASNTSYLDINKLAEGVERPDRFLGLHFFNPAHIMKLLEIVRGEKTSQAALAAAFDLAKRLNKIPVLAGVCDGFIGNRILARYRHAADVLLLEGALPSEIDQAMRSYGMAMGPYEAQDLSGLDIGYANRKRQKLRERTDVRYVPIADWMVENLQRLGRKSGAGWYDYSSGGKPSDSSEVADLITQASQDAGIVRRTFTSDDIIERIISAMTAEAISILDENIAERPCDIDLVLVHGYGFPRWRGGLMHAADKTGLGTLAERIAAFAKQDPFSWRVPPLMQRLIQAGGTLEDLNRSQGGRKGA